MSGIVSGIFNNVGGSSAKRDRSDYLNANQRLSNVFNNAFGFGQTMENAGRTAIGQGQQDLGTSGNYFRQLMANRGTAMRALAPQINAANEQGDAQRRQEAALGTARGGGTAGFNQDAAARRTAQINNMLFGAQTGAAGELGNIGRTEAGVGLGETGQGLGAESLASNTAAEQGGLALKSREASEQIHQQHVQQLTNAFMDILSAGVGGGGWSGDLKGLI